jgi:hypothetical protein
LYALLCRVVCRVRHPYQRAIPLIIKKNIGKSKRVNFIFDYTKMEGSFVFQQLGQARKEFPGMARWEDAMAAIFWINMFSVKFDPL